MNIPKILERAASESHRPSKIDAVPMGYLHITLGRGITDEYSFLLKCYNLQNPGDEGKTLPISQDDFHHQIRNIFIRGIDDGALSMDESSVGVVIRSPKNLEFYTYETFPIKATGDLYHISLFSNNGIDFFPNMYLGTKIDIETMDVEKSSMEKYGISDIESRIIRFEFDKLGEFRNSGKTEADIAGFLNSFYEGKDECRAEIQEKFDNLVHLG